nr:hypothetical protein [Tanacetum cinerariifolium]
GCSSSGDNQVEVKGKEAGKKEQIGGIIKNIDADEDVVLKDSTDVAADAKDGDADEVHGEDVNAGGVVTEGVVSTADDVVPTADEEPSIPSPTPPTLPPQPSHNIPSTSQVGSAQRIDTLDDTVIDDVSKQGGKIKNIDADEDVVLKDATDVAADAKDGQVADVEGNADIQGGQ